VHGTTGFTLDLLEIQSVPQALVCVTTYPTSDMGEPHTQEHLLLGKGNMGRRVASGEAMALTTSTAFTSQWKTCYSFYTAAGVNAFYDQLEVRMDALLHPDYTDEEIRREVRNFGVDENPDGTLELDEKGTVYAEMVSSMDQPSRRIYRSALQAIYGPRHPLSFSSGGMPEALRAMQPSEIRTFHSDHYHLANMGAVVSLPSDVGLEDALESIGSLLERVQRAEPGRGVVDEADLPAPDPRAPGEIVYADYPHQNPDQPGDVWLVWPADRHSISATGCSSGCSSERLPGIRRRTSTSASSTRRRVRSTSAPRAFLENCSKTRAFPSSSVSAKCPFRK
jgi:Zn-dependent M16 (insulinase) family peptidase